MAPNPSAEPSRVAGATATLDRRAAESAPPTPGDVVATSLADLAEDFDELRALSADAEAGLVEAWRQVHAARRSFPRSTRTAVHAEVARVRGNLAALCSRAGALGDAARGAPSTERAAARLASERRRLADQLRVHRTMAAAAITGADWQSPSFAHSVFPAAGRFAGRVREHLDDYRRDRHDDAARFEAAYLREYVDAPPETPLRALMTASGMAGFTTILDFLVADAGVRGPVLVGRRSYHECRQLVHRSRLGDAVVEVDERNPSALTDAVDRHRPEAVFVDALCNAKGIAVPDLAALVRAMAGRVPGAFLVVDTTGLSCAVQPFGLPGAAALRVVTLESLTKYAQFGLDRVAAGMVVAGAADGELLDECREHLGTNASDLAPHLVPSPNRRLLRRRLVRLGRNALLIATAVDGAAGGEVAGARYPGLPGHPGFPVERDRWFRGGYVGVEFAPGGDRPDRHRWFVDAALSAAAARGVPLIAGASFGFDTTRVYRTASRTDHGEPFVRIAAGTEHLGAAQAVAAVFGDLARSRR
jgi:cystathionine beta-lyase/cystathionine gamma-synthase